MNFLTENRQIGRQKQDGQTQSANGEVKNSGISTGHFSRQALKILSEKYDSVPVLPVKDHKGDSAHTVIEMMYSSERWQLLITLKQLVTTSNGSILTFWHPARLTTTVELKRPCLFKSYSQH